MLTALLVEKGAGRRGNNVEAANKEAVKAFAFTVNISRDLRVAAERYGIARVFLCFRAAAPRRDVSPSHCRSFLLLDDIDELMGHHKEGFTGTCLGCRLQEGVTWACWLGRYRQSLKRAAPGRPGRRHPWRPVPADTSRRWQCPCPAAVGAGSDT